MNCTICKKPVEEHGESRETDRCVAEKLGLYPFEDSFGTTSNVPHYSSPEMSAETWGLVEKMRDEIPIVFANDWCGDHKLDERS